MFAARHAFAREILNHLMQGAELKAANMLILSQYTVKLVKR